MSKALGISLFGGVAAWAAHLLLSYFLADLGCRGDSLALLAGRHALTVVAAASVVAATLAVRPLLAGQSSQVLDAGVTNARAQAGRPSLIERPFLARVAVILNSMFLFAIVLAGVMNFFLPPCV